MKWWYVLVVILGAGIGLWILSKYGVKKINLNNKIAVVDETVISNEVKTLPTFAITDKKGVRINGVQVVGDVKKWNSEMGIIEILVDEEKLWKLNIDPDEAIISVPDKKDKSKILVVDRMKENIYFERYWKTAFCEGDRVTVIISENKVKYIDNGGARDCGFRE